MISSPVGLKGYSCSLSLEGNFVEVSPAMERPYFFSLGSYVLCVIL